MVYTLLLHSLDPYGWTDRQTDRQTDRGLNTLALRGLEEPFFHLWCCISFLVLAGNKFWFYTCFAWAGGTFFPVVLLFQFFVLVGNRFWSYILLLYLEYHTVVVLC